MKCGCILDVLVLKHLFLVRWIPREISLEVIELSSENKVCLVDVYMTVWKDVHILLGVIYSFLSSNGRRVTWYLQNGQMEHFILPRLLKLFQKVTEYK